MYEGEWLTSTDPQAMLAFLRESGKLSERKALLFSVAVCRRIWPLLSDKRRWRAIEIAELFADGREDDQLLSNVRSLYLLADALRGHVFAEEGDTSWGKRLLAASAAAVQARQLAFLRGIARSRAAHLTVDDCVQHDAEERAVQSTVCRDIFGNPCRPLPSLDPAVLAWQDATLVRLARAAYEERELPSGHLDRARLAVLADALEEAGGDAELVAHLRDPGPHYRGCHVVDLLLCVT